MSFIILLACLMFATFCFQHISLHIQAPKKDPDYEDEDSDVGLFAFFTTILETPKSRVLTFHTFEKATFMVCSTIIKEIYISKIINFKCCICPPEPTGCFFKLD